MNIKRNNYEIYLMDYLDGKLSAAEVSELLLFLDQNPDIKEEFEGLQAVSLVEENDPVHFDKASLKKPVYEEVKKNYEELLIGKLEKDLSLSQYQELNKAFAVYPELKQDDKLFQKTKLKPELSIVFPNKALLKKRERILSFINPYLRVAAILIALALGWWMFNPLSNINTVKVADVKPTPKTMPGDRKPQTPVTTEGSGSDHTIASIEPGQKEKKIIPVEEKTRTNTPQFVAQIESHAAEINVRKQEVISGKPALKKINAHLAYQPQINKEQNEFPELSELVYQKIERQKEKIVKEENKPQELSEPKPADAGWLLVRLFNKVTGADVQVTQKYEHGKRKSYEIASDNFAFSTSK